MKRVSTTGGFITIHSLTDLRLRNKDCYDIVCVLEGRMFSQDSVGIIHWNMKTGIVRTHEDLHEL